MFMRMLSFLLAMVMVMVMVPTIYAAEDENAVEEVPPVATELPQEEPAAPTVPEEPSASMATEAETAPAGAEVEFTAPAEEANETSGTCDWGSWAVEDSKLLIQADGATGSFADSTEAPWYAFRESITSLELSGSVTEIGDYCFAGLSKLSSLVLPEGVTAIGAAAFADCTALKTVTFGNSIATVGDGAFRNCTGLQKTFLNNQGSQKVTVGASAFEGCTAMTQIALPNFCDIGALAFSGCTALKDIYIHTGVNNLSVFTPAEDAFTGVTATVHCPMGVTLLSATYGGTLTWDNVTTGPCGPNVNWSYNESSSRIYLSGTGETASYGSGSAVPWAQVRSKLLKLDMSDNITLLSDYLFEGCAAVVNVRITNQVVSAGQRLFNGCTALADLYYVGAMEQWNALGISTTANIHVPEYHEKIPATCTTTGTQAYYIFTEGPFCGSYYSPSYYGENFKGTNYLSHPSALGHTYEEGYCIRCQKQEPEAWGDRGIYFWELDEYGTLTVDTLHTSTWDIENFNSTNVPWKDHKDKIYKVVIGRRIRNIGDYAFFDCPNLREVVCLMGSMSSEYKTIGKYAFMDCEKLSYVDFGCGAETIGYAAFSGCSSLTSVSFSTFWNEVTIGDYAFAACSALREASFSAKTSIGSFAFYNCTNLKNIYINTTSSNINSITAASDSFYGVTATVHYATKVSSTLESSDFGGDLTWVQSNYGTFGEHVDWSLDPDTGILILSGTGWPYYTHSGSEKPWYFLRDRVTSIVVEEGITGLPPYTFEYMENVESVSLPSTLTTLCPNAFNDCKSMKNLLIPASVISFGDSNGCFNRCNAMTDLYYVGTQDHWNQIRNKSSLVLSYTGTDTTLHLLTLQPGTPATCTAAGIADSYRFDDTSVYGDLYNADRQIITAPAVMPALGHDLSHWIVTAAPSCTQAGQEHRTCSRCDLEEIHDLAMLDHIYSTVVTDPTCTEGGYITRTCSLCGNVVEEVTEALGHDLVQHQGQASTCKEQGWKPYESCSRCDYTTYGALPLAEHSYEAVVTKPTCTEGGSVVCTCTVCSDSYVDSETAALGHDLGEWGVMQAPTCTEEGQQRRECSRCSYYETQMLTPTGHSYKTAIQEPTCTESGRKTDACTICGDIREESIDPLGHDEMNHEGGESTCLEQGWKPYVTCTRCDYTTYEMLPLAEHLTEAVVTNPTCLEGGYTTHTCTVCGDSYVDDETEALGHDLTDWQCTLEPTCTKNGVMARSCRRCDLVEAKMIEALGHDYEETIQMATCTESGYATVLCKVCGFSRTDIIDPLGHDMTPWKMNLEPTCTEEGLQARVCRRCNRIETGFVEALGHDWLLTASREPTATQDGYRKYDCSRCGEHKEEILPATAGPKNPFVDVPEGAYFEAPVLWALEQGITGGTSAVTFGPDEKCTREQVVTFLWHANGDPEPALAESPFADVLMGKYYTKAVLWAVESGITGGTSTTTFGVGKEVTRGQFVTFLYNAVGKPAVFGSVNFTDVPAGAYFEKPVLWAVQNGITGGTSATTFSPSRACTRAQVVTFLYQAYGK